MRSIFEIYRDATNAYRWRLLDDDDTVIAKSIGGYETEFQARRDIDSFKIKTITASIEHDTRRKLPL